MGRKFVMENDVLFCEIAPHGGTVSFERRGEEYVVLWDGEVVWDSNAGGAGDEPDGDPESDPESDQVELDA